MWYFHGTSYSQEARGGQLDLVYSREVTTSGTVGQVARCGAGGERACEDVMLVFSHLTSSLLHGAKSVPPSIYPSSTKPLQIEPALPRETSSFLCVRSSSHGPMENPMEDSAFAGADLARLSPEAGDSHTLPINSDPGPGPWACAGSPDDVFGHFLYWRPPLPDISEDLELLLSEAGPQGEGSSRPETVHNGCVARSDIQKVLDSLQEHLMSDPDVQGKCRRRSYRANGCPQLCVCWAGRAAHVRVRARTCFPWFAPRARCGQTLRISPCRCMQGFCLLILQPSRCEVSSDTKDRSWASVSQWKFR